MKNLTLLRLLAAALLLLPAAVRSQTDALRREIETIVGARRADVGVAVRGPGGDTVSLHGRKRYPMQSVFKFHIALAMLAQVDKGRFSLGQQIDIAQKDLLPDLYSPLRDKYPAGGRVPLSEILEYTVAWSDNVGCDALLRLLGGPGAVEAYFVKNGFKDVSIKINEETMQHNWDLQFRNWTTPKAANEVLSAFYHNRSKLLSARSHAFLWKVMRNTQTGPNRLKGRLPQGTVVAHKTGSSGTNPAGVTAAVNDIGVVLLPDGRPLFLSVFVADSREDEAANEKMIADIARAVWDHFRARPASK